MKIFLILLFWLSSLMGVEESLVFFKKASFQEISEIQKQLPIFYAQELIKSGIFREEKEALRKAIEECSLETENVYYNLVLKENNCGYLVYSVKDQEAYLEAIYLEKEYRGQGLGTEILQKFEEMLKENGFEILKLYVFAHNQVAFGLYEKSGYIVENAYFNEKELIGYHMSKLLF